MARRKKTVENTEEGEDQTRKVLPDHPTPESHLSHTHSESKPGGDGDDNTPFGTAHAGAVAGGAAGQRVGLPAPLPAKEAEEAGFASPVQEEHEEHEE